MIRKHVQQSFAGGEMSPAMYGRIDDQKYQQGLAVCRNFVCLPQGPVHNRSGFAFVGECLDSSKKSRLIPFTFSSTDTMILEFGHKKVRVLTRGGFVPSGVGSTTPLVIDTPYDAESLSALHYAQSGDVLTIVHPSYPPKELRRYSAYDWRLEDISLGAPISAPTGLAGTYYCGDSQATDNEKKAYTIRYRVTAVKTDDDGDKESEASATVSVTGNLFLGSSRITLTWSAVSGASRYRVYKTYSGVYGYIGETDDLTFVDNNIGADAGKTPPRYDNPFTQDGGITSVTVTNGGSGYGLYTPITSISPVGSGWMIDGKGAKTNLSNVSLPFETPSGYYDARLWVDGVFVPTVSISGSGSGASASCAYGIGGGTTDRYVSMIIRSLTLKSSGNGYKDGARVIVEWDGVGFLHLEFKAVVQVSKPRVYVTDPTGTGCELEANIDSNGVITSIRVVSPGKGYTNPKVVIDPNGGGGSGAAATAAFGKASDYPGAVSYFEQRRIFAGSSSRPQFVWMTRPGTETDMSYTIPSQKDNRIKFRIAALQASRIRHIVPLSSLILMTTGAEFRVTTANDDTLTPSSVGVKPQSYVGASEVTPVLVNSSIIYAAERGGHLWELGYNWQASGFVTGDMCLRAAHLFDTKQVVDMAFAKSPWPIVWCVSNDGSLLGCTYVPEQGVGAWHRHDTKGGAFESVACVSEGEEDILYAVVRREINGKTVRYIERMAEREGVSLIDSFFVDCGVSDLYGEPQNFVNGLEHLEGCEVSILADGKVMPRAVVHGGSVRFPDKATRVTVGLPIEADMKTLPVAVQTQDGGFGNGAKKSVTRTYVRVYRSSGLNVGADFDRLYLNKPRRFEPHGTPPQLVSDDVEVAVGPKWDDSGVVCLRQDQPLPLMVCGITAEFSM